MSSDDIDLDVPEPLTEIDHDQQALEIEGPPSVPTESPPHGNDPMLIGSQPKPVVAAKMPC